MIKRRFHFVFIFLSLIFSPIAFATSGKLQWEMYLLVVTAISAVGAFWATKRKKYDQPFGVKVLIAGVYFWILCFLQLGILALLYSLYN